MKVWRIILRLVWTLGIMLSSSLLISCGNGGLRAVRGTEWLNQYSYTRKVVAEYPRREIGVWVDGKVGEGDRVAIEEAVEEWNYALNGNIEIKVVNWDYELGVEETRVILGKNDFIIIEINGIQAAQHYRSETVLAFANKIPGNVVYLVRDRVGNEDVQYILLHEIGHLLGAHHHESGLMKSWYRPVDYQCIDWETLSEVGKAQGFDPRRGNYCYYSR